GLDAWKQVVRQFQTLNRDGTYRVVFFVNSAPETCRTADRVLDDAFDPRPTKPIDEFVLSIVSDGTPAVSSHDAFLRYRPSQMPNAIGHSLGNANAVKADVLFEFLRDRVLQQP